MGAKLQFFCCAFLVCALLGVESANGKVGDLVRTIDNGVPEYYDGFGLSMTLGSGTVLVGAPYTITNSGEVGAAYLMSSATGLLVRKFDNPAPVAGDYFGGSVAAFGASVAIGSPGLDSQATHAGAVYIFSSTTGALLQTLRKPTPSLDDGFGTSVAALGYNVLVGAPGGYDSDPSIATAYLFNSATGEVLRTFKNPAPGPNTRFGYSVTAISDRVLVKGARYDSGRDSWIGQAHLFNGNTGGLIRTLEPPKPPAGQDVTITVAAAGTENVLIGARWYGGSPWSSGSAVYLMSGASGSVLETFQPPGPGEHPNFGCAMAMVGRNVLIADNSDSTLASGAGAVHLYDGQRGLLLKTFANPDPHSDDSFGTSLAVLDSTILVSAPIDPAMGNQQGAQGLVYMLEAYGGTPAPGDLNFDGWVDRTDVTLMIPAYGTTNYGGWEKGDFNGDWKVDVGDLGMLGANFTGPAHLQLGSPAVPEPTTLTVLMLGALLAGRRRRPN